MSLTVYSIAGERGAWSYLADVAKHLGMSQDAVRALCTAHGARIHRLAGYPVVDVSELSSMTCWKQLVLAREAANTQGRLL